MALPDPLARAVSHASGRASEVTGAELRDDADDAELLALWADEHAAAARRQAAFHLLVRRYQRRLFSVCHRILGSSEDAEEAVQETFVRLARHANGFRGDAKVSTWLYSIARNVCTDRVRYSARRPSTPVADVSLFGREAAADDDIAAADTVAALRQALAGLDERSRALLLMIAVDELTYEEAAELTGMAVGTVKSRVSRARARLGAELMAAERPAVPERDPAHPLVIGERPTPADPRGPPA